MNTGNRQPIVETIPPAPPCKCQRIGRFMVPFVRWTCPVHGEMPKEPTCPDCVDGAEEGQR